MTKIKIENSHYFSPNPDSEFEEFSIVYNIKGKKFQSATAPGVFSYKRLDLGTRVLLEWIIENLDLYNKSILDLGSGWGAVSQIISTFFPDNIFFYTDINKRALKLTEKNLEKSKNSFQWKGEKVDCVIANPPIKSGKKVLYEFITLALDSLKSDGEAYFVIHKNLGSDSLLKNFESSFLDFSASRILSRKGYRIIKIVSSL